MLFFFLSHHILPHLIAPGLMLHRPQSFTCRNMKNVAWGLRGIDLTVNPAPPLSLFSNIYRHGKTCRQFWMHFMWQIFLKCCVAKECTPKHAISKIIFPPCGTNKTRFAKCKSLKVYMNDKLPAPPQKKTPTKTHEIEKKAPAGPELSYRSYFGTSWTTLVHMCADSAVYTPLYNYLAPPWPK